MSASTATATRKIDASTKDGTVIAILASWLLASPDEVIAFVVFEYHGSSIEPRTRTAASTTRRCSDASAPNARRTRPIMPLLPPPSRPIVGAPGHGVR